MIFPLIAVFIVLVLLEVPKLLRERNWRGLSVYAILMGIAFTISVLLTTGINMPMPGRVLQQFLKDYLHLNYK